MCYRPRRGKELKLTEIIDELERSDDEDAIMPSTITNLPPENANAEITDEYSGEENIVTMHNLPGSQLWAIADVAYSDFSSDDEDNIPLLQLAKRQCIIDHASKDCFDDRISHGLKDDTTNGTSCSPP